MNMSNENNYLILKVISDSCVWEYNIFSEILIHDSSSRFICRALIIKFKYSKFKSYSIWYLFDLFLNFFVWFFNI
jgi:hypothetical protein